MDYGTGTTEAYLKLVPLPRARARARPGVAWREVGACSGKALTTKYKAINSRAIAPCAAVPLS